MEVSKKPVKFTPVLIELQSKEELDRLIGFLINRLIKDPTREIDEYEEMIARDLLTQLDRIQGEIEEEDFA